MNETHEANNDQPMSEPLRGRKRSPESLAKFRKTMAAKRAKKKHAAAPQHSNGSGGELPLELIPDRLPKRHPRKGGGSSDEGDPSLAVVLELVRLANRILDR